MWQYLLIFIISILGWSSGKLINYFADVLPVTRRLSSTHCRYCQYNQPFVSYFGMKYHCPFCGAPYLNRVWIVDFISVGATLLLWFQPPGKFGFWVSWLLAIYLGVVLIIDIENHLVLHITSIAGLIFGITLGIWRHGLLSTVFGGLIGFSIMYFLYLFGGLFALWLARKRGEETSEVALGFGDVNFAGIMGLMLGWPGITAGLILTILFGGMGGLLNILWQLLHRRYKVNSTIPYAPFMVLSILFLLYR